MKKKLLVLPVVGAALALLPVLSSAEDSLPATKKAPTKLTKKAPTKKKATKKVDLSLAPSKMIVEGPIKKALERTPKTKLASTLRELRAKGDPPLSTGIGKGLVEGPVLRRLTRTPNGAIIVTVPGVYPHPAKASPWAPGLQQGKKPVFQDNKKEAVERPVKRSLRTGESKRAVERPVKRALKRKTDPALGTGRSKKKVEAPLKRALRRPAPRIASRRTPLPRPGERVQPGLVTWHKSYEKALEASKRSGKPVMLLHTLGRLDDRFC